MYAADFWLLVAAISGGGICLLCGLILAGRLKRKNKDDLL
jgi:hypothetical protein